MGATMKGALKHGISSPRTWKLVDRDLKIQGWCFGNQQVVVQAVRARRGHYVWSALYGLPCNDSFEPPAGNPGLLSSGFEVNIKVPILPGRLRLEAQDQDGCWHVFYSRFVSRWRRMLGTEFLPRSQKTKRQQVSDALRIIGKSLRFTSCVLALCHSDYRTGVAGVQKLLQQEQQLLAAKRISYLEIHPAPKQPLHWRRSRDFVFGLYVDSVYVGGFVVEQLCQIFNELARLGVELSAVHVHHLMGFDLEAVRELLGGIIAPKTFFIHDFYSICRQPNLLQNDNEFCGGPAVGSPTCQKCSYGAGRNKHFAAFTGFWDAWKPTFVAPSKTACDIWSKSFPDQAGKVMIIPHQIPQYSTAALARQPGTDRLRIAYVGYQHANKGWEEWKRLTSLLSRDHYELLVLGSCTEFLPGVRYIPVSFVKSGDNAMVKALREEGIDIAFLWSLVPETYSFTLYESMAAGCFILTNPASGNIAAQVSQSGCGIVASQLRDVLDLLRDSTGLRARLDESRRKNPPFDLVPNPERTNSLASGIRAGKSSASFR